MEHTKMYIAVLDEFDDNMVPTLVAHQVLRAHTIMRNNKNYEYWFNFDFRKCVVRVNRKEFDKIKNLKDHLILAGGESKTMGGKDACVVVCPNPELELPNVLRHAKLWYPKVNL